MLQISMETSEAAHKCPERQGPRPNVIGLE